MRKRTITACQGYAHAPGEYNNEVMYLLPDGYRLELYQCGHCAALFVIDHENPATAGVALADMVGAAACPACGASLRASLHAYPAHYLTRSGRLAAFVQPTQREPHAEPRRCEVWEIEPATAV